MLVLYASFHVRVLIKVNPNNILAQAVREKGDKNALLYSYCILIVQVKLVNIRSDDIVDGNPKLILGLVWTIILHFQVSV